MKKTLITLTLTLITTSVFSQISFEKGYFINNSNKKVECFIKNIDWKDNPTAFDYRLSENSEVKIGNIGLIKEFGIDGFSRYVRTSVGIDRSSNEVEDMSNTKKPNFSNEQLFLKVLIQGEANLYYYEGDNIKRFFYNLDKNPIEQLVYKYYLTLDNKVGENNEFRAQLWKSLKCESLTKSHFENLTYFKNQLTQIFIEYNECKNATFKNFEPNTGKGLFHLTLKTRLSNNNFKSQNVSSAFKDIADYGNSTNFEFGFEVESIFKFNRNKWALVGDFNYQSFKGSATISTSEFTNIVRTFDIDYKSIEVGVGVRHYFFLGDNRSKLFMNILYTLDFPMNSNFTRTEAATERFAGDINRSTTMGYGFGYKYDDKLSLEIRIEDSRDILDINYNSQYSGVSFILGYTLL